STRFASHYPGAVLRFSPCACYNDVTVGGRSFPASEFAAMKCQNCPKTATLHITEVVSETQFEELHLCEDCAQKYLYEPQPPKTSVKAGDKEEADEAGMLGGRQCDVCGLKFIDF